MYGSAGTFYDTKRVFFKVIRMQQPIPLLAAFSRPVRHPDTEADIILRRARRVEFERREVQKADRRASRRARVARVLGR